MLMTLLIAVSMTSAWCAPAPVDLVTTENSTAMAAAPEMTSLPPTPEPPKERYRDQRAKLVDTNGSMGMTPSGVVHLSNHDGHLVLVLNLTREMSFLDDLLTAIPEYEAHIDNPPLSKATHSRLLKYRRRIVSFFKATERKNQEITRPTRFLPLAAMGLGIVNFAQLLVLHGEMSNVNRAVSTTVHRVDQLTRAVSTNTETLSQIIQLDSKVIADLIKVENETRALRLSNSVLGLTAVAFQDVVELTIALITLSQHKLPFHLFDLEILTSLFDEYAATLAQSDLQPVDPSASQLLNNPTSFLVTGDAEEYTLMLCIPIPLEPIGSTSWTIYKPDPALLLINQTLWTFQSDHILLDNSQGRYIDTHRDFLDKCSPQSGPRGLICPLLPPTQSTTCLISLVQNISHPACQEELKLANPYERVVFQRLDGTFLSYTPTEYAAQVECPFVLREAYLYKLQRITLPEGCTLRAGSFIGFHLGDMTLGPVFNATIRYEYPDVMRMLNISDSPVITDLVDLQRTDRLLLEQAGQTMQQVKEMVNQPLREKISHFLPETTMALVGILLLACGVTLGYFAKRYCPRMSCSSCCLPCWPCSCSPCCRRQPSTATVATATTSTTNEQNEPPASSNSGNSQPQPVPRSNPGVSPGPMKLSQLADAFQIREVAEPKNATPPGSEDMGSIDECTAMLHKKAA